MKLIEINEAFASMPLMSSLVLAGHARKMTERIREKFNVNGGTIAIGHPIGGWSEARGKCGGKCQFYLRYPVI